MSDAVHDVLHHAEVQLGHLGGDGIHGVDGPDDNRPVEGTLAVDDAGGLDVGHYGEVLPDLALQAVLGEFLTEDGVGFPNGLQTVTGDGADTADAQTGAGEGLTVDHVVGQTKRLAYHADLVLVEQLHRLHQLKLQILGQAAYVVVGLDAVGFQNVGVNGALSQEGDALQLLSFLSENVDELLADDLALLLRVGNAGQLVQKAIHSVHIDEVGVHLVLEHLDDLLGLALAEQTVVHVNADELLADGFDEQSGDYGAVHTAGEGQQDFLITDLLTQFCELLVDKALCQSGGGDALHGCGTNVA